MKNIKTVASNEFAKFFHIKVNLPTKKIALIKLIGEEILCTRLQFYTEVFNIFEKTYPNVPLPLRLYSDSHLSFQEGWSFTSDECSDYLE